MGFESDIAACLETMKSLRGLGSAFDAASTLLCERLGSGGKALVCGNGGSAADAMHLATELVCRFEKDRRHLPAICLNSSASDLTAFSNDFSFAEVFARQLEAFAAPGDVLIVLTTSGMSPNVVAALEVSKRSGIDSIALLGRDGGACAGKATVELTVPSSSTARIQEAHKLMIHSLCRRVDEVFE